LIDVKVTIVGEPDAHPLTKDFHFTDEVDMQVLSNSVETISEKLSKGSGINVNEVILVYLHYLIQGFRSGRDVDDILLSLSTLLSNDQVMIGVAESLREIKFDIITDNIPSEQIVLRNPIPPSTHDLTRY
jgi:urease gamma subunit